MIFSSPISFQHRQRSFARLAGGWQYVALDFSYRSEDDTTAEVLLPGEAEILPVFYPVFFAHLNRCFHAAPPLVDQHRGTPELLDKYRSTLSGRSAVLDFEGPVLSLELPAGWHRIAPVFFRVRREGSLWFPSVNYNGEGELEAVGSRDSCWIYFQDDRRPARRSDLVWHDSRCELGIGVSSQVASFLNDEVGGFRGQVLTPADNDDFYIDRWESGEAASYSGFESALSVDSLEHSTGEKPKEDKPPARRRRRVRASNRTVRIKQ